MRSFLIGISTVACALATGDIAQTLLAHTKSASDFTCDLSPSIDPKGDGLPSSSDLFSSHDALKLHIKRHQAIVRVPSVCYDDMGSFDGDERWIPFYHLHDVLRETYPLV
jgi:Gly-Xaa carboxypeptidase